MKKLIISLLGMLLMMGTSTVFADQTLVINNNSNAGILFNNDQSSIPSDTEEDMPYSEIPQWSKQLADNVYQFILSCVIQNGGQVYKDHNAISLIVNTQTGIQSVTGQCYLNGDAYSLIWYGKPFDPIAFQKN